MIIRYLKIWFKVVKKHISLKLFLMQFAEHLVYFIAMYYLIGSHLLLAIILLVTLMAVRSSIRMFTFYKELINSGSYHQILLKPIDPLFGLLVYKRNMIDIVILIPLLLFLKFRKNK
jgi:uncharacterized membrane protein HdeD (DUF308 family)